ncbi:hypothetical protein [uncultured Winogradskyella sp.]|uniref:hypothetical protein n=1 Tax=uncultured Winogradskyella sp. TaxID=395353 RepID=UPI00260A3AA8|nr:hypothetical protein [uncultured Winogradskyella sp.]
MKSYIKSYFLLFLIALFFASCQDESVEIINPDEQEAILPNSALSNLMLRTSANAVSDDNVLDNSNCFSVELPVTVIVGNITITIQNEEGLDELEELLEELEGEIPEFVFPITIISADYVETVIENQDQLEALLEDCVEDNDVIECVDFVYPISFSVLNSEFVIIDTVTIESNEELHDFLEDLEDSDINLVALNFPVTLEYADGNTITVNTNEELSNAIEAVGDDCDDDDYENCDVDEIKASLKECKWVIEAYSSFPEFEDFEFVFNDDFTFDIIIDDNQIFSEGNTWEVVEEGEEVYLILTTEFEDFGGDWKIVECDYDELYLTKNDQTMLIEQYCETDLNCSAEDLSHDLIECYWFAGTNLINDLANKFVFTEDGTVKVYTNNEFVEVGTWNVGVDSDTLTLVLNLTGNYDVLSGVWEVIECHEGFYGLSNGDNILHLEQECFDDNPFECYPEEGVELVKCDEDNDGYAQFNIYEAVPACDNSGASVAITFHTTSEGAENNSDFLEGATAYTNVTNPQTVYVKVALVSNPEEKLIYPVELIVEDCNEPNPFDCFASFDAVIELCDEGNDGYEAFDLTIAYSNCTPFVDVVTYHTSLADADADINPIADPEYFINTSSPQTIYVRAEVGDTYEVFELQLKLEDCTNPGDCTEGDVDGILMNCEWKVTELNGDDNLIDFRLTFLDTQELLITDLTTNETVTGTWSTSTNNDGNVEVILDGVNGPNIQAIAGVWTVVECTGEQLILHRTGDQMTLDKICD